MSFTLDGWYVYIIKCSSGAYYTGIALDVEKRFDKHLTGKGSKIIRALGTPEFIAYKQYIGPYDQALKRERAIKKMSHKEKEKLSDIYFIDMWK